MKSGKKISAAKKFFFKIIVKDRKTKSSRKKENENCFSHARWRDVYLVEHATSPASKMECMCVCVCVCVCVRARERERDTNIVITEANFF